ncbi:ATP-dependent permease [Tilletia horrida]|nr:ATP-dependent permease [Tilletia horrida]
MSPSRTDSDAASASESRLTNGSSFVDADAVEVIETPTTSSSGHVVSNNFDTSGSSNASSNAHSSNLNSSSADADVVEVIGTPTTSQNDLAGAFEERSPAATRLLRSTNATKRPRRPPSIHIRFSATAEVDRHRLQSATSSDYSSPTASIQPRARTVSEPGNFSSSESTSNHSPDAIEEICCTALGDPSSDEFETRSIPASEPKTPTPQTPTRISLFQFPPEPPAKAVPSLSLLLQIAGRRNLLLLGIPALLCTVVLGLLPVGLTYVFRSAFDEFTKYTESSSSPYYDVRQSDRDELLHTVTITAAEFAGLGLLTAIFQSIANAAWTRLGDQAASNARVQCYQFVSEKEIAWFDNGMVIDPRSTKNEKESKGAAGLATIFSRDADDIRKAYANAFGIILRNLTTSIAAFTIAFIHSRLLSLVAVALIPLAFLLTAICERMSGPLMQAERDTLAELGRLVQQTISSITVVKAFNGQSLERTRYSAVLRQCTKAWVRTSAVWSLRSGASSILMLLMFVVSFWFGTHLVQSGKLSAGVVYSVFWACLLVTTSMEQMFRSIYPLHKGKVAAANLEDIRTSIYIKKTGKGGDEVTAITARVDRPKSVYLRQQRAPTTPMSIESIPNVTYTSLVGGKNMSFDRISLSSPPEARGILKRPRTRSVTAMRKIQPTEPWDGSISFRGICFSYPSRPDVNAIHNVDMYFSPNETSFVVGPSGAGKSTIASLILGLYKPNSGSIMLAGNELSFLDTNWCLENILVVAQSPVLFDMSIHDNIAIGSAGRARHLGGLDADTGIPLISREDVIAASKTALLHEYIISLPDGYDTLLGDKGLQLSGGQKQKVAIARAILCNPALLILDEATSALDKSSASLVHSAIRQWRQDQTTVIITHDLSQVGPDDWVFVMSNGRVKEQGRAHQIQTSWGNSGHGPNDSISSISSRIPAMWSATATDRAPTTPVTPRTVPAMWTNAPTGRSPTSPTGLEAKAAQSLDAVLHGSPTQDAYNAYSNSLRAVDGSSMRPFSVGYRHARVRYSGSQRNSLPFLFPQPTEAGKVYNPYSVTQLDHEAELLHRTGNSAALERRRTRGTIRARIDEKATTAIDMDEDEVKPKVNAALGFIAVSIRIWKRLPNKAWVLLGLIIWMLSGGTMPIFSYFLSQLLAAMSDPTNSTNLRDLVLVPFLIAILHGTLIGVRQYLMEHEAERWIGTVREDAYERILRQGMSWYNLPENQAAKIAHTLVRDGEDARETVGSIWGQLIALFTIIAVSFIWALKVGWHLALVGLGFVLAFAVIIHFQAWILDTREREYKANRDEVTKRFFDMAANIRSIRSMALDHIFGRRFYCANDKTRRSGRWAGLWAGLGVGLAEGLIYCAEGALFAAGGVLVAHDKYTFQQMITVFTLMVFAVTYASQLLANLPGLAKATQAVESLERLLDLSLDNEEALGNIRGELPGAIEFDDVHFRYPDSPRHVLKGLSFTIMPGETVAIVGASGCGKSSILNLLQRYYLPSSGKVRMSGIDTRYIDISSLREHMAVVAQNPQLLEMSVGDNILYGANGFHIPEDQLSEKEISERDERVRAAAHWANMSRTIRKLPKTYGTRLGEDGSQFSGGQTQRLAIARALMRRQAKFLILDEFTSALDAENQKELMNLLLLRQNNPGQSYRHEGRRLQDMLYGVDVEEQAAANAVPKWFQHRDVSVLVVTHNLEVMRRCERILVVADGRVVQDGPYEHLLNTPGPFATLARAGEWGFDK